MKKRRLLVKVCFLFIGLLAQATFFNLALSHAATPEIAGGSGHSLALHADGALWSWGRNDYGQLGDGTTVNKPHAVQVSDETGEPITGVKAVAAGTYHNLALLEDGTVLAWGKGILGDGSSGVKLHPVQVTDSIGNPVTGVISIAANYYGSYALLEDGTVMAWGRNEEGQLGDGTTLTRYHPVYVTDETGDPITGVKVIAADYYSSFAVLEDGNVLAWGYNYFGQLGDGTKVNKSHAVHVIDETGNPITGVKAIAAGRYHGLALLENSTVLAWGNNGQGQLGNGTTVHTSYAVKVINETGTPVIGVIKISADDFHNLAVTSNGSVLAWGRNNYGQLGDGTTVNRYHPVPVIDALRRPVNGVIAIATGVQYSHALLAYGAVLAWGRNYYGQLGDGTLTDKLHPVYVVDEAGSPIHLLSPNQVPTADPGGPYTFHKNQIVFFDGTASTDPDGDPLIFIWDFGDGTSGSGASPSHVYDSAGVYTVGLTVNDGTVDSMPAYSTVTISNQAPEAAAGGPYNGYRNQAVTFNANGSSDPDGDTLTYTWDFGDGTSGYGVNPTHVYATFGTYTVTLTVSDGEASAQGVTTVEIGNNPPVADAGSDQDITGDNLVYLAGTGSHDPDGQIVQYEWRQISGPPVKLVDADAPVTNFKPLKVTYPDTLDLVFELTVTDNDGAIATDHVLVHFYGVSKKK